MADATPATTISRRSTRLFLEDQEATAGGVTGQTERESRQASEEKEQEKSQKQQKRTPPSNSFEAPIIPMVDFGTDLRGIFPSALEDMNDHVDKVILASKKGRGEGRPIEFGIVILDSVYRSSFPMVEDFQFLETLGLKTVISLVNKGFSNEFEAFIKDNGINHVVIDMEGTKKVEIPDAIMHSVMEVVLNKANHPLLIHCNHGKHRTGCAVAVIRHVAGWKVNSIIQEYRSFAEPKVRDCDLKYIEAYKVSSLEGLFREKAQSTSTALASGKMRRFYIGTALALSLGVVTVLFWGKLS
ncbi:tyrosine-phosphatase [Hyphodiscus hymeniophilus]|uniref:diphosphoinositol-polyphosphate diphosphatase n=1 Tax=Hyphodiscus hymeniophilus TaxID=353542 RepID=A0A9P6VQY9_9HELO|nr:tyrosine-phosphatase [Hyphodiscus hymeniophilus]